MANADTPCVLCKARVATDEVQEVRAELHKQLGKIASRLGRFELGLNEVRKGLPSEHYLAVHSRALDRLSDLERQVCILARRLMEKG